MGVVNSPGLGFAYGPGAVEHYDEDWPRFAARLFVRGGTGAVQLSLVSNGYRVGIVGATGAVGQELLTLLGERPFPFRELRLLASARSAGQDMGGITVQETTADSFAGLDVVFFSAGAGRSREFAPAAIQAGATVIDNSSAFRMDPSVPLVVPEINFDAIGPENRLIANPNCTAILLLMAISPLRRLGKIRRVVVSTYQSASGAGAAAMQELEDQTHAYLHGQTLEPVVFPHPYAFNLFSHNTPINDQGWNEEEWKVREEARKILSDPDLSMHVTCVRVPVLRAHSESVLLEFDGPAPSPEAAREALAGSPGVQVVDDPATNTFPMPVTASGANDVLVGRLRRDLDRPECLSLFLAGDQLRKGAALNALQIAEALHEAGRLQARATA